MDGAKRKGRIDLNEVTFAGYITRDAEVAYNGSGNAYCYITIANSRGSDNQDNEIVNFISVCLNGEYAEKMAQYLTKGKYVIVTGQLRTYQKDLGNNQKETILSIGFPRIHFVPNGNGGNGGTGGNGGNGNYNAPTAAPQRSGNTSNAGGFTPTNFDEDDDLPF